MRVPVVARRRFTGRTVLPAVPVPVVPEHVLLHVSLDGWPVGATAHIFVDVSEDDGVTWPESFDWMIEGGKLDRRGNPILMSTYQTQRHDPSGLTPGVNPFSLPVLPFWPKLNSQRRVRITVDPSEPLETAVDIEWL